MLLLSVSMCDLWGVCCAAFTEQLNHPFLARDKQRNASRVFRAGCVPCCTADITDMLAAPQGDDHSQNLALHPLMNVLICAISMMHVSSSS